MSQTRQTGRWCCPVVEGKAGRKEGRGGQVFLGQGVNWRPDSLALWVLLVVVCMFSGGGQGTCSLAWVRSPSPWRSRAARCTPTTSTPGPSTSCRPTRPGTRCSKQAGREEEEEACAGLMGGCWSHTQVGGNLEAFNLCGREFVEQRVSARLPVHHVIMNLPNSAIDFLGRCATPTPLVAHHHRHHHPPLAALVRKEGVLMGDGGGRCGWVVVSDVFAGGRFSYQPEPPMLHVYCFSKAEDPVDDAIKVGRGRGASQAASTPAVGTVLIVLAAVVVVVIAVCGWLNAASGRGAGPGLASGGGAGAHGPGRGAPQAHALPLLPSTSSSQQ